MPGEVRVVRVRRRQGRKSWEGTVRCDGSERTFGLGSCRSEFEARTKLHAKASAWRESLVVPGDADWLRRQQARPLDDHICEFIESVESISSAGQSTVRKYREHLRRLVEDLSLQFVDDLRVERVVPWFAENKRGYAPKSLRHHRATIVMFSKWLWERGILPEHRLQRLPQIRMPASSKPADAFSTEELQRLIAASPQHRADVYHFMACTGLRTAEAKRLLVDDVRVDAPMPHVLVRAPISKNQKSGEISLAAPGLVETVRRVIGDRPPTSSLIVAFPTLRTLKRDMAAAGVPSARPDGSPLSFASFRKSAAQQIVDSGMPLRHAQAQLRHSRPEVTASLYTKSKLASRDEQMRRLPSLVAECPPKVSHVPWDNGGQTRTSAVWRTAGDHNGKALGSDEFGHSRTGKEIRGSSEQKWSRGESNPRAETVGTTRLRV